MMSYDPNVCNCPECSSAAAPGCSHEELTTISPRECCDKLLSKLDLSAPIPTVYQCPACLRLWEWCGMIDGKGVAILIDSDLKGYGDDIPDC